MASVIGVFAVGRRALSPGLVLVPVVVGALLASGCGGASSDDTSTPDRMATTSTPVVATTDGDRDVPEDRDSEVVSTTTGSTVEVDTPAESGPCAEPAPSDLGTGMVCADSGFRLLDGFAFPNWAGNVYDGDGFGADELVSLYGAENVCAEFDGEQCVLYGGAAQRLAELDALVQSGRCEGMAVLGARFHVGLADRTVFRSDATITAQLPPTAPQLIGVINHWWATQFSQETIATTAAFRELGPAALLRRLIVDLGSGAAFTLGIYSEVSGHALLPVAVTVRDDGIHEIHVYDGNVVGKLRVLEIDEEADSWRYAHAAVTADVPGEEWSGGRGTIDLTPMASREGVLTCDSCGGEVVRGAAPIRVTMLPVKGSAIRLAITGPDGDVVEVAADGIEMGIVGAIVQIHRDGPARGVTVLLPAGTGDLVIDAEVTEAADDPGVAGEPDVGAPGALVSVVRSDASAVQVEVSAVATDSDGEVTAGVRITADGQTDAMTVEVGDDAEARASMASERQTMTVELKAEQVLEMERPDTWTDTEATVEVVVTEADEVVFTETFVEDADQVTVTEMAADDAGRMVVEVATREVEDVTAAVVLTAMVDVKESVKVEVDDPMSDGSKPDDDIASTSGTTVAPAVDPVLVAPVAVKEVVARAAKDEVGLAWELAEGAVDHYAVEVRQPDGSWKVVQMVDEKTAGASFGGIPAGTWDVRVVTIFRDGSSAASELSVLSVDGKDDRLVATTTVASTSTSTSTSTAPVSTTTDPPDKPSDDGKGDDGKGADEKGDGKPVTTTTAPVSTTTDPPDKAPDDGKGDDGKGGDGKGDDGKPVTTTTTAPVSTTTDPPDKPSDDGKGDDGKPTPTAPPPAPTTTAAPPPPTPTVPPPAPTTTAAPPPPTTTAAPPPPTTTKAPPPTTTKAVPTTTKAPPTTTKAAPTTTKAPADDGKSDDGKSDDGDGKDDDGK